ncbi:MAG: hypothetical protein ACXWC9_10540, partial [Pseudobdellovibrionaceae bacterium]
MANSNGSDIDNSNQPGNESSLQVRLTAWALGLLLVLAVFEGGARLETLLREPKWEKTPVAESSLDGYEVRDVDRPGLWRLKPGYQTTIGELISEKQQG